MFISLVMPGTHHHYFKSNETFFFFKINPATIDSTSDTHELLCWTDRNENYVVFEDAACHALLTAFIQLLFNK